MSQDALKTWIWRTAQGSAVAATVILVWGLFTHPDQALQLFWKVVIPLVPASLLISPLLWRNACPLATSGLVANQFAGGRTPSPVFAAHAPSFGIVLLIVLVPARHFVFNQNGPALAVTIVAILVTALLLGAIFDAKSGFCNAFCPVLPVERLYGQYPLLEIESPRCSTCTVCSQGCIDLAPGKTIAQTLGPTRRSGRWIQTSFGAFAAAFPGFVIGYFTVTDGPLTAAPAIYAHVFVWSAGSYAVVAIAVRYFEIPAHRAAPTLAALAIGAYYVFAAPEIVSTIGLGPPAGDFLRIAAMGLVFVWWWHERRRSPIDSRESPA